jgi:hypothetical protein
VTRHEKATQREVEKVTLQQVINEGRTVVFNLLAAIEELENARQGNPDDQGGTR